MVLRRLRLAAEAAKSELRASAADKAGRFVMFGSFARDDIVPTSDFDVVVDFPRALEREARDVAEIVCRKAGLKPDVHLDA